MTLAHPVLTVTSLIWNAARNTRETHHTRTGTVTADEAAIAVDSAGRKMLKHSTLAQCPQEQFADPAPEAC